MDNANNTDHAIQVIDPRSEKRQDENGSTSIHFHQNNYVQINFIQNNGFANSYSMSEEDEYELELHHKLQRLELERSKMRIDEIERKIKQLETDLGISCSPE